MMNFIQSLKNLLTPDPPDHPFRKKAVQQTTIIDNIKEPDNIKDVTWGIDRKVVKAKTEVGDDFLSWEQLDKGKTKLSPADLDEYDMTVIRQKKINTNNYKLVKPYVLAGWTNEQIASVLNRSRSWVERLSPRVKDAMKLRSTPTLT